jgi:predicted secreted protein
MRAPKRVAWLAVGMAAVGWVALSFVFLPLAGDDGGSSRAVYNGVGQELPAFLESYGYLVTTVAAAGIGLMTYLIGLTVSRSRHRDS